jgi:ATP-dependent RNA/DNA helicase IGHMBP2
LIFHNTGSPPGTGKTTTVVALIREAVARGQRILVSAPSNVAVDNVLASLVASNVEDARDKSNKRGKRGDATIRVVRLGHPARIQPSIVPYSLEALIHNADGADIIADVRQELQGHIQVISDTRARRANDKRIAYQEIKTLRRELRQREENIVNQLLGSAQVVLATCVGAASRLLRRTMKGIAPHGIESIEPSAAFDLVIIDEAAQALEAACWIPMLLGKRTILAGDHCQLPPTVQSTDPQVSRGLSYTLFERTMELYNDQKIGADNVPKGTAADTVIGSEYVLLSGCVPQLGKVSRMLQIQYRMHHLISDWASKALYHGRLLTHESVRDRTLSMLVGKHDASNDLDPCGISNTAFLLVDTAGCTLHECVNPAGSRFNPGECAIVANHVRALLKLGVEASQIAVISPYNGQVELMRSTLLHEAPQLEIRSVDGFQGGEREAVIISLVRSSDRRDRRGIGFLRDDRRLNVAVTRAKRHCCIVCDSDTVRQSMFIKDLITWIETNGDVRTGHDYDADNECSSQRHVALGTKHEKSFPSKLKANSEAFNSKDDLHRVQLLERIRHFALSGEPGQQMRLSHELSSHDRMLVHQEAEGLGISHISEGVNGVDRRIVLSIPCITDIGSDVALDPIPQRDSGPTSLERYDFEDEPAKVAIQQFFDIDESNDEESLVPSPLPTAGATTSQVSATVVSGLAATACTDIGSLHELALERAQRERERRTHVSQQQKSDFTGKKATKEAQKLGGKKKASQSSTLPKEPAHDSLDEMAFLEMQIHQVQSSHGRSINATGTTYRTIVNGILIDKPQIPQSKRDPRASAVLQSKLQQAQNARKIQPKRK